MGRGRDINFITLITLTRGEVLLIKTSVFLAGAVETAEEEEEGLARGAAEEEKKGGGTCQQENERY